MRRAASSWSAPRRRASPPPRPCAGRDTTAPSPCSARSRTFPTTARRSPSRSSPGEWTAARTRLRHPEEVAALGLDLRLGTAATALSPASRTVTLTDGEDIGWDAVLIATGVRPRRLPWCGLPGTHVLRHLEDALALRERLAADRRLVIVGAGFLGSEVASSARALGARVTLVEPAPVPLARVVGHQVGAHIARLHREHGVDLRTGTAVTGVETAAGRLTGVRLSDATTVPADDVLVAIGSEPATDWLTGSGVRLDDGVVCDAYNSAAPGVYAAGDVARWHNPLFGTSMRLEHRTNAAEQAMAAARHLLHPEPARPFAPVPYFWTDQYGIRVQAYRHLLRPRGGPGGRGGPGRRALPRRLPQGADARRRVVLRPSAENPAPMAGRRRGARGLDGLDPATVSTRRPLARPAEPTGPQRPAERGSFSGADAPASAASAPASVASAGARASRRSR
ncbi:ferredoxin reductase [Streptomyces sp. SPB78]|nr:ferredoxin reductase [Streptomyces sp. SPB78]